MSDFSLLLLLPWALTLVFLTAAVVLLIVVPLRMKKNTSICTTPVSARIVDISKTYFGSRADYNKPPSYAPIYEFSFNGEVHSVASRLYSSRTPTIGEVRTLMIDPRNPEHFYDPSTRGRTKLITAIVGAAMLVCGMVSGFIGFLILLP
jgi:hypothetical protein